jgi:hypothetical protein
MNRKIQTPLSNNDLDDFASDFNKKPANMETYESIKKMKSINQLFKNKYDYLIIFLEVKNEQIGHWLCIFFNDKKSDEVFFYDSYGENIKKHCPALIPLLFQKFKKITSNKISYQNYGDDSATCGRHCLFSCIGLNNIVPEHNFEKLKKIMVNTMM